MLHFTNSQTFNHIRYSVHCGLLSSCKLDKTVCVQVTRNSHQNNDCNSRIYQTIYIYQSFHKEDLLRSSWQRSLKIVMARFSIDNIPEWSIFTLGRVSFFWCSLKESILLWENGEKTNACRVGCSMLVIYQTEKKKFTEKKDTNFLMMKKSTARTKNFLLLSTLQVGIVSLSDTKSSFECFPRIH